MPSIIINSNHIHLHNNHFNQAGGHNNQTALPVYIGECLSKIPPKQLCRCLRETFMLNWESLQESTPDFKNFVTEMAILLARLDAEEAGLAS